MTNNDISIENAPEQIDGERTIPSVNRQRSSNKSVLPLVLVGAFVSLAMLYMAGGGEEDAPKEKQKVEAVTKNKTAKPLELPAAVAQIATPLKPTEIPQVNNDLHHAPPGATPPPMPDKRYGGGGGRQKSPEELALERKLSSKIMAVSGSQNSGDKGKSTSAHEKMISMYGTDDPTEAAERLASKYMDGSGGAAETSALESNMKPTRITGTSASLLPDRNMMLTKGAFLDCALETALDSSVPGMTSCRVTRDIYSANGKVILIDRGSRITGEYKSNMKQGQARLFVLWTRIETPYGVLIDIDSPGTDALGRSGMDGYVDTHFFERFGGAILLSLVDDIAEYSLNKNKSSDDTQITFTNTGETTKDAAAIALENSINIPPTLRKNQGDHINIFVARDLDFSTVYDLEPL